VTHTSDDKTKAEDRPADDDLAPVVWEKVTGGGIGIIGGCIPEQMRKSEEAKRKKRDQEPQ
jgi:hypothetical protein